MKVLLDQVTKFLDSHESAPSAWCLVKGFHDNADVSDADTDLAYSRTEGENDDDRELMLNNLTPDQLMKLTALILEISLEKLEESEA